MYRHNIKGLLLFYIRNVRRLLFGRRRKPLTKLAIIVTIVLFSLHFLILPNVMGYYNDDCYLDNVEIEGYRHLVRTITQIYEEFNQTYWLDYGTLLGYHRNGDIIPHDGDVDIGRLVMEDFGRMSEFTFSRLFTKRLSDFGLEGNVMTVKYEVITSSKTYTMSADLYRWRVCRTKKFSICLHVAPHENDVLSTVERMSTSDDVVPYFNIIPLKTRSFLGQKVKIPNRHEEVLKQRYPNTLGYTIPYKWKCWLPWTKPPQHSVP